nr:LPS biosynthesis protein,LICD family protein [Hymenolepis microstoma]
MTSAHLEGHWFLDAGALLGSIKHHDFIPWDDDADFKLHIKHRPAVQAALKKLAPKLHTYSMRQRDKLLFPLHQLINTSHSKLNWQPL